MSEPAKQDNADFIQQSLAWLLHEADFFEAMAFYDEAMQDENITDEVIRELAKGDRYFLFVYILNGDYGVHPWLYQRCREVQLNPDGYIDLWSREHFKDLSNEINVLTPSGTIKHGDLKPGDTVYSPEGKPVKVLAVTGELDNPEMYYVRFGNLQKSKEVELHAGADHLWNVEYFDKRRISGTNKRIGWIKALLSTRELIARTHQQQKTKSPRWYRIPYAKPLESSHKDLIIKPYTLGAWLGDGSCKTSQISNSDDRLWERIERDGYDIGENIKRKRNDTKTRTVYGLIGLLREIGLYDCKSSTKHIPEIYQTASLSQRTALIQGLMDTDGTVSDRGNFCYATTSKQLADDVARLVTSLGTIASINEITIDYEGEDYLSYRVSFSPSPYVEYFSTDYHKKRIAQKRAKHTDKYWYIRDIESAPTVPSQCIQVEGGRYLAGESLIPTHNSTLITYAGIVQEILNDPEITIGIFSHTRPIAKDFLGQIKREFEDNGKLKQLFPNILWTNPRGEATTWSKDGGITVKRAGNPREATVEAWGLVDGQPTGKHFKLLVYDDVVTIASVTTADQIKKTTDAWDISSNLGSKNEHGAQRRWMIGTRYNYADSYNEIMDRKAAIPRIYPATDDGTITGTPVFMTPEAWELKVRETSLYNLACQQLQNPNAGNMAEFKPEYIRYYEVRPLTLNVYIMCDYAGSRSSSGSSRTAFSVIGVDNALNKYFLDGACHRMSLTERWKMLKALFLKWKSAPGVQIVDVGYERFGAQSDIDYFEEKMKESSEPQFPIKELNWPRDGDVAKDNRIRRLEPDFRNWGFFLPYEPDKPGEMTKVQREAKAGGVDYLIAKPIRCINEERIVYNLMTYFIKTEFLFFPNTTAKDLLDATSRIYDMDYTAPVIINEADTLPEVAEDS